MADADLRSAAETAVRQCLAVEADDRCTVVYDDGTTAVAGALLDAVAAVTDEWTGVRYPVGATHGGEPPDAVAAAVRASDVFLAPTTKSLSHTRARQRASEGGARGATLPGITESVFVTGLDADYDRIAAACGDLRDVLDGAERVRVRTEAGTDVTFEPGERAWRSDTGIVHDPGAFSNLPAGEVFVSPVTADGTVVIDGTMRPYGLLSTPIEVTIENGSVTAIDDDEVGGVVEAAAEEVGDAARNVAELGIGANVGVTELVGSVLLDEKAAGTVHVAIGDDAGIGGDTDAPIHLDGVVRDPTVTVDGEELALPTPE